MSTTESRDAGVEALLREARWELMPFESFYDQVEHVPLGQTVTLTASPQKGVDPTVNLAVQTVDEGTYDVVPHIAARMVRDRDHLSDIATRLKEANIEEIFVPGGDIPEPEGEFSSAFELLTALDDLGFSFREVGITGYPEGHPVISDADLASALENKRPYATHIVTQICYDPGAVVAWIEQLRDDGVELPVYVGIPGVMNYGKLIGISRRVGVGDSIRFIRKTDGLIDTVKRLIGSRGVYRPDDLVEGLLAYAEGPEHGIAGLHLYTFNQVPDTAAWRESWLSD